MALLLGLIWASLCLCAAGREAESSSAPALRAHANTSYGRHLGDCAQCNVGVCEGGCKCDASCGCKAEETAKAREAAGCGRSNPCAQCEAPVCSGGCKCDSQCRCDAAATAAARASAGCGAPPPGPCEKCNRDVCAGGCKCDSQCRCKEEETARARAAAGCGASACGFVGSNLYYAAGLSPREQESFFGGLRSAGVKVLRVWLDGQQSPQKGTAIESFPDLEPREVGVFDDTVLDLLDAVMLRARSYGIKLMVSMHSFNALKRGDVYAKRWGVHGFYENPDAAAAFDRRLRHILEHRHPSLGRPWRELRDHIFAFEAENEAMTQLGQPFIAQHQGWQCARAQTIKSSLGSGSGILVTTGGGSWLDQSMQEGYFHCNALDVLAIHAYGPSDYDANRLRPYVQRAQASGQMLIMQEWGACYFDTDNNNCPTGGVLDPSTRAANIRRWAHAISSAGIPWMYWQVLPNLDPHWGQDFEIGQGGEQWGTFLEVAAASSAHSCAFDYKPWLAK